MKVYERIFNDIKEKIENGTYQPEEKLPSLREFSKIYKSTPVTIKKSLSALIDIGYVYGIDRVGFFVSSESLQPHILYYHDSKSLINVHHQKMIEMTYVTSKEVSLDIKMNLSENTQFLKISRLWYYEELPIAVNTIYLPHKKSAYFLEKSTERLQKWLDLVLNNYDIIRYLSISLVKSDHASRQILYLNEKEPLFCFTQAYHTMKGQLAGYSTTYTPCSEIKLKMKY